jgi:hypothetical protein
MDLPPVHLCVVGRIPRQLRPSKYFYYGTGVFSPPFVSPLAPDLYALTVCIEAST